MLPSYSSGEKYHYTMRLKKEWKEKKTHSQDTSSAIVMAEESILSAAFALKGYL